MANWITRPHATGASSEGWGLSMWGDDVWGGPESGAWTVLQKPQDTWTKLEKAE